MPRISTRSLRRSLLIGLPVLAAASTSGAVVQCLDAAGSRYFDQFHCPPDTLRVEPAAEAENRLSIITTVPLSEDERQALADLEKSLTDRRKARTRVRERSARARSAQAARDTAHCSEAEDRLKSLAATRRKGYAASAEHRLETEEARWRAIRRSAC